MKSRKSTLRVRASTKSVPAYRKRLAVSPPRMGTVEIGAGTLILASLSSAVA
jgi:hypothetical protein